MKILLDIVSYSLVDRALSSFVPIVIIAAVLLAIIAGIAIIKAIRKNKK